MKNKYNSNSTCVSINLIFDKETYDKLSESALLSFRSLKMEATLRLLDHVNRHSEHCKLQVSSEVGGSVKVSVPCAIRDSMSDSTYRGSYKINSISAEGSKRIKDHLQRYKNIAAVGVVNKFKGV